MKPTPELNPSTQQSLRYDLEAIVGSDYVSDRLSEQQIYNKDMWPRLLLTDQQPPLPYVIVWPNTESQVQAIIKISRQYQVPIIPYGAGSGVCGALVPSQRSITVDLKRFDNIGTPHHNMVTVGSGVNGVLLENSLNDHGYSLGHFPSSLYCSTVGGWLSTRAIGQMSSKYGGIEHMIITMTIVTGRGDIIKPHIAMADYGLNWMELLLGSEGTLGIITQATFHIHHKPEKQIMRGFRFNNVQEGTAAIRYLLQNNHRPSVIRLYDNPDTIAHTLFKSSPKNSQTNSSFNKKSFSTTNIMKRAMNFALTYPHIVQRTLTTVSDIVSPQGCLLIIGCEGSSQKTQQEARLLFDCVKQQGGTDCGQEPGDHWLAHRYSISYKMPVFFTKGMFVDTMEVAATWNNLLPVYYAVKKAVEKYVLVTAHFSHAYPSGCSIYFSFVGKQTDNPDETVKHYDALWDNGLTAVRNAGGTISHHHGIGTLKYKALCDEIGHGTDILCALKNTCDPDNILNPDKIGSPCPKQASSSNTHPQRKGAILDFDKWSNTVCVRADTPINTVKQWLTPHGVTLNIPSLDISFAQLITSPYLPKQALFNKTLSFTTNLPHNKNLQTVASPRKTAGPNLFSAFMGTDILGDISEIVLEVSPINETTWTPCCRFYDIDIVLDTLHRLWAHDVLPEHIQLTSVHNMTNTHTIDVIFSLSGKQHHIDITKKTVRHIIDTHHTITSSNSDHDIRQSYNNPKTNEPTIVGSIDALASIYHTLEQISAKHRIKIHTTVYIDPNKTFKLFFEKDIESFLLQHIADTTISTNTIMPHVSSIFDHYQTVFSNELSRQFKKSD